MINIVLYLPEIPPNTGNIIRTCYATGAKLHIIKPISFDIFHPNIKRAAAGRTIEDIDYEIHENYNEFIKKYRDKKIYYLTRYGLKKYTDIDFSKNEEIWIMFGTESTGIPKKILQSSIERCIRIPMKPKCRSLNLANSVNLVTYEILRQKNFEGLSEFENQKGKDFILNDE
ncbi:MAG: tRNA (cytidine(34)-2'-O)-methyltransferase [Mycoplasma sp.]|nr:tRNA (cytidine(34)-2'-O)-methyltransferase [Mycoplasma sp.]